MHKGLEVEGQDQNVEYNDICTHKGNDFDEIKIKKHKNTHWANYCRSKILTLLRLSVQQSYSFDKIFSKILPYTVKTSLFLAMPFPTCIVCTSFVELLTSWLFFVKTYTAFGLCLYNNKIMGVKKKHISLIMKCHKLNCINSDRNGFVV